MTKNHPAITARRRLLLATVALVGGAYAGAAVAADAAAGTVEEVTVTARFREESLNKVPIALSVVSGDKTLWTVSRGTSNDPGMFVHVRTATLQETINQMGGVDAKWIAETPVPTLLSGFNDLNTLPSSRWALGGVKDK